MNNKDSTLGFIVGLGCGVGIALLLAPKSGDETRSVIANRAREGTDRLKHQVAGLRDSATELLEKGRNEVERHKEGLQHAVDAGKRAYHESVA
jgi:gas vesicle protein